MVYFDNVEFFRKVRVYGVFVSKFILVFRGCVVEVLVILEMLVCV